MKQQIRELEKNGLLGAIRQRLGGDSDSDSAYDKEIASLTVKKALSHASAWTLGGESWAKETIENFGKLVMPNLTERKVELEEKLISSSFDGKINLEDAFSALDEIMDFIKKQWEDED